MYLNDNLDNIISILEEYKSTNLFNKTDTYHIDISVLKNESKQIAISKNKLTPIEDIYEFNNSNNDDSIIWVDKFTYDLLKTPSNQDSSHIKSFFETSPQKQKTDTKSQKTTNSRRSEKKSTDKPVKTIQTIPPETILKNHSNLIENHDYDCVKVNRPAAFAIKRINENYYLLYYRKSVYDSGTDLAFRKYLNEQPGVLAVYKYLHSIDNLRNELNELGLKLRHNGKNELSDYQVDKLLDTFSSLSFL